MEQIDFSRIYQAINSAQIPDCDLVVGIAEGGIIPAALAAAKKACGLKIVRPDDLNKISLPEGARRILLVDDNQELLYLLKTNLMEAGDFEVATAEDGLQALKLCVNGDFDLILSDTNMPVCDGIEFLRLLRRLDKTTPVIMFFSGYNSDPNVDEDEVKRLGANKVLKKVANIKELMVHISPLLGIKP